MTVHVIALPGGVMPAALRYQSLASSLGGDVQLHCKDLEVYSGDQPPHAYSIDREVEAVTQFAESLGLDRFHLLGYSAGGFVSLAFAGCHPDRLLSLALFEPASIPGQRTVEEVRLDAHLERQLAGLAGPEFMRAFIELQVRSGVELAPPAGPPPPWMSNRPQGLATMMAAFRTYRFDRASLRECRFPAFLGYGDLTAEHEEVWAAVLSRLLPDVRIKRFSGVHHFMPPEQIYTSDHVGALRDVWAHSSSAHWLSDSGSGDPTTPHRNQPH